MLFLVLPWDAEAEASAEWRYLRRWLIAEGRAVFGDVRVASDLSERPPDGAEAVLVLESCRVLIGGRPCGECGGNWPVAPPAPGAPSTPPT